MSKPINTKKTFQQIRELPLAVSFEQVEKWVKQQPTLSTRPSPWSFIFWSDLWSKWREN